MSHSSLMKTKDQERNVCSTKATKPHKAPQAPKNLGLNCESLGSPELRSLLQQVFNSKLDLPILTCSESWWHSLSARARDEIRKRILDQPSLETARQIRNPLSKQDGRDSGWKEQLARGNTDFFQRKHSITKPPHFFIIAIFENAENKKHTEIFSSSSRVMVNCFGVFPDFCFSVCIQILLIFRACINICLNLACVYKTRITQHNIYAGTSF